MRARITAICTPTPHSIKVRVGGKNVKASTPKPIRVDLRAAATEPHFGHMSPRTSPAGGLVHTFCRSRISSRERFGRYPHRHRRLQCQTHVAQSKVAQPGQPCGCWPRPARYSRLARPAQALDPQLAVSQYVFDNWQIQQGLPQNSVEALARTPDGYLWLATHEGLVRFDGVRFTVFDRSNTPQLRSRVITRLHVDTGGRLWIGTRVGVLTFAAGQFQAHEEPGLRDGYIRAIASDNDGHVWVGTDQALFEIAGTSVRAYGREQGLDDTAIRALQIGNNGTVWAGTNVGGLYRRAG